MTGLRKIYSDPLAYNINYYKMKQAGGISTSIGSIAGAAVGTAIAPGIGTTLGSATGSAVGGLVGSVIDSSRQKNVPDSNAGIIENNISSLRRGIIGRYSGSYAADALDKIESQFASVKSGVVKSSGNSSSLLKSLVSVSRGTGKQFNAVLANIDREAIAREGIISQLTKNIADRELQTNLIDYSQSMANSVSTEKASSENISGLLASLDPDRVAEFFNNIKNDIGTEAATRSLSLIGANTIAKGID